MEERTQGYNGSEQSVGEMIRQLDGLCHKAEERIQANAQREKQAEAFERSHEKLAQQISEIRALLTDPAVERLLNDLISGSRGGITRMNGSHSLLCGGVRLAPQIAPQNYGSKLQAWIDESKRVLNAALRGMTNDIQSIRRMCIAYNFLWEVVDHQNQVLKWEHSASKAARAAQPVDADVSETLAAIRSMAEQLRNTDGTFILGNRSLPLSQNEKTDIPLVLGDEPYYGSFFLHMPDAGAAALNQLHEPISRIFYENCLRFPPYGFSLFTIESSDLPANPLRQLTASIARNEVLKAYLYGSGTCDTPSGAAVLDELQRRKSLLMPDGSSFSITRYNRLSPLAPLTYILVLISGYPDQRMTQDDFDAICLLLRDGARFGIYTVIFGENKPFKPTTYDPERYLPLRDLHVRSMDVGDLMQSSSFTLTEDQVVQDLKERAAKTYLPLTQLLEAVKDEAPTPVGIQVTIPVGLSDGKVYDFATSSDRSQSPYQVGPFAMVVGSSGFGKTELIHTLILSGASRYSPDELELYLVDFKTDESSMDYSSYIRNAQGEEGLYIPHVKGVIRGRGEGRPEEVLRLIAALSARRSRLFAQYGITNFRGYHKERERGRDLPPLPQIYFLIDEYNQVFNVRETTSAYISDLYAELGRLLNTVRSSGISIILIGQNKTLSSDGMKQIDTRIAYSMNDPRAFTELFESADIREDPTVLFHAISGRTGYAACARKVDGRKEIVRMAFARQEDKLKIAAAIRARYPYADTHQIVPGNESVVNANDYPCLGQIEPDTPCTSFPLGLSSLLGEVRSAVFVAPQGGEVNGLSRNRDDYQGFLLVAEDTDTQARIETDVMLSFLYEHLRRGIRFERPRVFLAGHTLDDHPAVRLLEQHGFCDELTIRSGFRSVMETIVEMHELLDRRMTLYLNKQDIGRPYIFVFHDICEWSTDLGRSLKRLEEQSKASVTAPSAPVQQQRVEDMALYAQELAQVSVLPGMDAFSGVLADLRNSNFVPVSAERSDPSEPLRKPIWEYTDHDLWDMLKDVLHNGSQRGIYLLLSGNSVGTFEQLNLSISRDLRSYYTLIHSKAGKANCCYLQQYRNEIRLFDYEHAEKWWDSFKRLYDLATPRTEE